ncbi:bacteriocin leader domain-containing protein [Lactobacillus amylovorus]|uniref:Bacteriocin leader domain-containing protein n=1 Tax=Lactobacillus amylovorus TaxID=1604 RepID=A0A5E8CQU7_LACAM|nr:bacteriocin [Lactobacillus amylovorus]QDD71077.1 bacteriocin leader domain-containing protein [Lactobacillus amylovorus]
MMKEMNYKELEKVSGGTNWLGVGGSCLSGFIDALPSESGMIKGCVEGAVKDFAKQNRHKKHKHR